MALRWVSVSLFLFKRELPFPLYSSLLLLLLFLLRNKLLKMVMKGRKTKHKPHGPVKYTLPFVMKSFIENTYYLGRMLM